MGKDQTEENKLQKGSSAVVQIEEVQLAPFPVAVVTLRIGTNQVLRGVLMDESSIVNVHSVQEEKAKSFVAKKAEMFPKKVEVVEPKTVNDLAAQSRRRGRKPAWVTYHRERGPCCKCSVCGTGGPQGSFTHPVLWRNTEPSSYADFNLAPESCVCQHCYTTKIKRSGTPAVTKTASSPPTSPDNDEDDADVQPESKRKFNGPPVFEARRGRCHHWRTVHSTEGPCSRCSACGGAPQAVRYSHPMSWSPGMQKEAKRIGLSIRSCVCQPCVEAIRHCAITPAQIASVKDKAANTNGGDADNKTASQTSAARIPYESPPRNSSSSDVSVGSVVSTASSVQTCPLPYCNDVVYCSVGSTTPEMVAKVFKVDVEIVRPPPDELQEVLLCFNHYHHCYRKVKSERNGVATSTTPKAQPNPQSSLSSGIGHVTCRLTTVGNTATPPFTPQQQGMLQASSFPPQQQGMAYATPFPPQQPGTSFCSA